jgi:hypothetical protein
MDDQIQNIGGYRTAVVFEKEKSYAKKIQEIFESLELVKPKKAENPETSLDNEMDA